jgi:hypothetical protein
VTEPDYSGDATVLTLPPHALQKPSDERKPLRHIRAVLLAKHARHVVVIHFAIALFTAALAFDYLAQWNPYQNTDC